MNKTPEKTEGGWYHFDDYPEFKPNLSPREVFLMGAFGGTYWRPIFSGITNKFYKNQHKKYPESWWNGIPEERLTSHLEQYNTTINSYKRKVGESLEFCETNGWATPQHPYGWFQWYCDFFSGERSQYDLKMVQRWVRNAGPRGGTRTWLITLIRDNSGDYKDVTVGVNLRQSLLEWGYHLTNKDYEMRIKEL
tara:strand:- start:1520 stop:2098 length:579 start_codon:yes stop_codon:yes gene_type:complete